MEIIVRKRDSDWIAHDKNDSRFWDAGNSVSGAIGNLIRTHPDHFNIKITEEED